MTRMVLAKWMGVAMALAVMAGFAGTASAGLRAYCDSYARDVAHRKTNGGADAIVGTVGGALGGALIGGLVDNGRGAGRGAIIGGVGGTILGAGVTSDRYRRAYDNAFARCMDNYEGQRVRYQATDQPDQAAAKPVQPAEKPVQEAEKPVQAAAKPVQVAAKPVQVAAKPVEVAAKPEMDSTSRDKACARKYRSYDPKIGKYKSLSGKMRPCRLF